MNKRNFYAVLAGVLIAPLFLNPQVMAANPNPSQTPLPTPSTSVGSPSNSSTPAPTVSTLIPNYRDPEIPQVQGLVTSTSKVADQFTLTADLTVKIHSNTLNSIEINLLPKTSGTPLNPKLTPPCVKLGTIKATSAKTGADMSVLQSRASNNGYYIEHYLISYSVKLPPVQYATDVPTYQDICDGQYVISTIILKDAASHVLTITANASSTAAASTTGTSSVKSKYTDAAIMQADFWTDGFSMPCTPSTNLAPTLTNTVVNGRTVQTTAIPTSSPTIRSACNQTVDFGKIYLKVDGSTNASTTTSGSSTLPIIDYVSQTKVALSENERMKKQIDLLNSQIAALQRSVTILRGGGKLPTDTSTATASPSPTPSPTQNTSGVTTDYKALSASLQLQVNALKKQIMNSKSSTNTSSSSQTSRSRYPSTPTTKPTANSNGNNQNGWQQRVPTPATTHRRHHQTMPTAAPGKTLKPSPKPSVKK